MKSTISVSDLNFSEMISNSKVPVVVDFWAPWCGPCSVISPIIDEIAKDYSGRVKVLKMNVDENANIPTQYGIKSLPHLALFKDGNLVDSLSGAVAKNKIEKLITDNL